MKRKRRAKKLAELPIHKHILMAKHVKISETEKKQLFAKYTIDVTEMPKIRSDDPAINQLDAKAGDIIKITRTSTTAGETFAYRVVIDLI